MTPRFPTLPGRSIGIGLDLPWGGTVGFATDASGADAPSPRLQAFLETRDDVGHLFVSWQPRSRGRLDPTDYHPAWDALMATVPDGVVPALHHTALNLAHSDRYEREDLLAFTNALIERYGMAWVNEDLGYWSIDGKPLPYPLPPLLTDDGLAVAVDSVVQCNDALDVPLLVEFPGFSQDWSLRLGDIDAYDFFREVVHRSNSPCTLDTGHLLSWRWLVRHRGPALLGELERLPLEHCFEVHLSGARIAGERFYDTHDGGILDAQIALLEALLVRCPNLQAITFEDPRLLPDGTMDDTSARSFARIQAACAGWLA